jgi:hypothetical protein
MVIFVNCRRDGYHYFGTIVRLMQTEKRRKPVIITCRIKKCIYMRLVIADVCASVGFFGARSATNKNLATRCMTAAFLFKQHTWRFAFLIHSFSNGIVRRRSERRNKYGWWWSRVAILLRLEVRVCDVCLFSLSSLRYGGKTKISCTIVPQWFHAFLARRTAAAVQSIYKREWWCALLLI